MPTKFDYLSPGIELREIDQSAIAAVPENDGLLLIGRAKKGPAMKPIKITSLADFQEVFGTPMDGVKRGDPWREGNTGGGGWAAYAAEAYLAAGVGPVKFIRLAGIEENAGDAGWSIDQNTYTEAGAPTDHEHFRGALGIFVATAEAITPVDAATATMTIADLTDPQNYFQVGDTLTINFVGGSYTFALSAAATSGLNIDISDLNGSSAIVAANDLALFIDDYLTSANSNDDFTVSSNGDGTITFEQSVNGLDGNDLLISFVTTNAGGLTGAPTSNATFSGGTIVTPTSEGVLAAIVYSSGSNLVLHGTARDGSTITSGSAAAVFPGSNGWSATLTDGTPANDFKFTFNFNTQAGDQNFIRSVLNTDATLLESGWNKHHMFLGETFEYNVSRLGSNVFAWVAPLKDTVGSKNFVNHNIPYAAAKTGWFIGSKASNYKRLFRFAALDEGKDFHKNHRVVIKNIARGTTTNPDGRFSVEIHRFGLSVPVETFPNVTLNPSSPRFIGKIIGDLKQTWSPELGKNVVEGTYSNNSSYVRVEMAQTGVNNTDIPLGFFGPALIETSTIKGDDTQKAPTGSKWIWGADTLEGGTGGKTINGLYSADEVLISWPTHALSVENSYGSSNSNYPPTAIMGLSQTAQAGREDFADIGVLKADYDPHLPESAAFAQAAYVFSLELMEKDSNGLWFFNPSLSTVTPFQDLLSAGVKQFAAPFFGGSDGVDITVENPFNEVAIGTNGYAKYSMESAIEQVADYYTIRYDLISIPGVTNGGIISKLISQTEGRGDALAIIDLDGIYQSAIDAGTTDAVGGSVSSVISTVEGGTASSYAAAYYPNVRIADVSSGNGSVLMAPPSVAAIGAIAKSEALSQPWFAPAGFNRGALAPLGGTGGANVVGTLEHLSKADRDALYDVNINPIARFPATGDTVIFGQKTLQPEATALDRINVRRMMIYLKKRIGAIADTFLFEQGVQSTYDRFKGTVEPILAQVRSEFGITDYKVVLDETTTTPDLQDRNIMYAKVYVKPAKAIEYVVIDFVVTQTGVEF